MNGLETVLMSQVINRLSNLSNTDDPDFIKCYKLLFSLLMKVCIHR